MADLVIAEVSQSARCQSTLDLIKHDSYHTVRLVVEYTAKFRPDRFGCTTLKGLKGPYHFRTGTGVVDTAYSRVPVPGYAPGTTFTIYTAAHVVYNDDEAKATTAWFNFYKDGDNSGVVKAKGVRIVSVNERNDFSMLMCQVAEVQAAQEIWRKLDTQPPAFPSNFSLSYTISCPHGRALRVSFGDLKAVKHGGTVSSSEINRIKLMLSRLPPRCNIDIDKLLYFYYRRICTNRGEIQQLRHSGTSDPVSVLLKHVEDQHLVKKPTEAELVMLQEVWDDMWQHVGLMAVQELSDQGLSQSEMRSTLQHDKPQMDSLRDKILRKLTSQVVLPAGVKQRLQKVVDEISAKVVALRTGRDVVHSDRVTSTRTMTYSIPTCPGSSGAQVTSDVVKDGEMKLYRAIHSMGGGTAVNRSGLGVVMNF